jgi:hypothetical protein
VSGTLAETLMSLVQGGAPARLHELLVAAHVTLALWLLILCTRYALDKQHRSLGQKPCLSDLRPDSNGSWFGPVDR